MRCTFLVQMRDLVNRPTFLLRKKLDNVLFSVFPEVWVPLYNSVTFSDMRYSECVRNRVWQDQVRTHSDHTTRSSVTSFKTFKENSLLYSSPARNETFMVE